MRVRGLFKKMFSKGPLEGPGLDWRSAFLQSDGTPPITLHAFFFLQLYQDIHNSHSLPVKYNLLKKAIYRELIKQ